jgi:hypothetical protein
MSSGKTPGLKSHLEDLLTAAKALNSDPANDAQNNKLLFHLRAFILSKAPAEEKQAVLQEVILSNNDNRYLTQFVLSNIQMYFLVDPGSKNNITKFLGAVAAVDSRKETDVTKAPITKSKKEKMKEHEVVSFIESIKTLIKGMTPQNKSQQLRAIAQKLSTVSEMDERGVFAKLNPEVETKLEAMTHDVTNGGYYRSTLKDAYDEADFLGAPPKFIAGPQVAAEKKPAPALPTGTFFKPIPKGEEKSAQWLRGQTPAARQAKEEPEKKQLDLPPYPKIPGAKK